VISFIAFGSVGPEVGGVHQRLIELGYSLDTHELARETFGMSTDAAIRNFQRDQGLKPDGVVGPFTAARLDSPVIKGFADPGWRCSPSTAPANVRAAIAAAVGDIGRAEEPNGSNDGPMLKKYDTRGAPWCALAVSTWLRNAEGGCPFGRQSSSWTIYEWAKQRGMLIDVAQPGDVGLILRGDRRGHALLIGEILPDGRLCTIEGNSGNAVRGKVRARDTLTAIARVIR